MYSWCWITRWYNIISFFFSWMDIELQGNLPLFIWVYINQCNRNVFQPIYWMVSMYYHGMRCYKYMWFIPHKSFAPKGQTEKSKWRDHECIPKSIQRTQWSYDENLSIQLYSTNNIFSWSHLVHHEPFSWKILSFRKTVLSIDLFVHSLINQNIILPVNI